MPRGSSKRLPNDGTIERAVDAILSDLEQRGIKCVEWYSFGMSVTTLIIDTNPNLGWGRNYGRMNDAYMRLRKNISHRVNRSPKWRKGSMSVLKEVLFDESALGEKGRAVETIPHRVPALRWID